MIPVILSFKSFSSGVDNELTVLVDIMTFNLHNDSSGLHILIINSSLILFIIINILIYYNKFDYKNIKVFIKYKTMGIKHFFYWFRNNFSDQTKPLKYKRFSEIDVKVDNLMIDMNGIFHNSAQKIYKYGNFKVNPRLLKEYNNSYKNHIKVFEDVCEELKKILQIVDPKKRLIFMRRWSSTN